MRRNRKQAKKNLIVFIVITILMIATVLALKYYFNSIETDTPNEEVSNKENGNTDKEEENDNKENIVKNEFENTSNYKSENLNRYQTYKEKNPNLDYETVVTYVNIGLDYDFYDYISDATLTYDNLLLMNKYYKLPTTYEPNDLETISSEYFINGNSLVRMLRKEAKEQFEKMAADAINAGYPLYGQSAYRPYSMQEKLYNNAVSSYGKTQADRDTARPGHSEHQTGLCIDVSSTKGGNMLYFDNTESFTWMQNNAFKYGFILRYPEGKENITGFMYESWHYRYVTVEVATDMHENYPNLTYDEYYYKFIEK